GGQTGPAPKVTLAKGHSCVYNADAAARNPRKKPNLEDPREKCDWGEARGTLNAAASSTAAGSHRAARGAKNPRAPRRRAPGSLMGVSTAVEGGGPGRLCVAPGVGSATVEQKGISWPLRAARPLRAAVALVALSQWSGSPHRSLEAAPPSGCHALARPPPPAESARAHTNGASHGASLADAGPGSRPRQRQRLADPGRCKSHQRQAGSSP
ncbi:unnamed protein product, partial [Prorocentrum cordatum]